MLRAIIVDDEELSVKRLKKQLEESGLIEVCDTFLNPLDVYAYVLDNPIDIAFLDISMPGLSGMSLSKRLTELDAAIETVFVTGYDHYAVQAFEISALDYLLKPVSALRLSRTLEKLINKSGNKPNPVPAGIPTVGALPTLKEPLTVQETKVLRLVADGLLNKEIARQLNITGETVKFHIKNVYRKLDVNNRVQAVQRAKDWDVLH